MKKELSNCCKAEVKLNNPNATRGETVYYICTKCNKPCDLYSEIKELSDEELLESCLNLYATINNPTISYPNEKEKEDFRNSLFLKKQELLKRLSKENWKKELIEKIDNNIHTSDYVNEKGIFTMNSEDVDYLIAHIIDLINNLK